jgi:hypothetical protein
MRIPEFTAELSVGAVSEIFRVNPQYQMTSQDKVVPAYFVHVGHLIYLCDKEKCAPVASAEWSGG